MKNSSGGFALGLFGTIAIGNEFRIFGEFTFIIIVILWGLFMVAITLKKFLGSGSSGERIAFEDRSYDWNAPRVIDHHGLGHPRS